MRIIMIIFALLIFVIFTGCDDKSTETDNTAPIVVITNPADDSEFASGQIVTIRAEASDNKGIEKVEFLVNGELEGEDSNEPYQYEWDTSGFNGDYNLLAKAWDTSGNTGLSEVINIISGGDINSPDAPCNPDPNDNAVDVSVNANLSWSCNDPDGDDLTYDVYFGTDPIPDYGELLSENQNTASYDPPAMNYENTYYWKIVASDGVFETEGDVWSFTTVEEANYNNMVFVQGGTFEMGDHFNEGDGDELPVHEVTLSSFYIGQYEVTQGEYEAVMDSIPAYDYGIGDNYPVYYVTWYDAVEYCNALSIQKSLTPCYDLSDWSCDFSADGYRLPTEAEWEYASRGGMNWTDNYRYSGTTDNLVDYAWYDENSGGQTHEVVTKLPNQLNIYDMSGNVFEWCNDRYSNSYYDSSPVNNPTGPVSGSNRVIRGGFWVSIANYCRVTHRDGGTPDFSYVSMGFRILRAIE